MEWYFWLIICIASAILIINLILAVLNFIKVKKISRLTVNSSLKMMIKLSYDSVLEKEMISFTIFNSNFNDVVIRDFGIYYRNQFFNFVDEYMKEEKLGSLPIIPARNSINYKIDPQRLEKFILNHNYKSRKIFSIESVVIDSVGNAFTRKDKALTNILSQRQKDRIKQAKFILHDEKIEEFKKLHDNREPLSNFFWKIMHPSYEKNPKILEIANSFQDTRKFSNDKENIAESSISQVEKNTSTEIKLTYLEPETGKKKRKTKAVKVDEVLENNTLN